MSLTQEIINRGQNLLNWKGYNDLLTDTLIYEIQSIVNKAGRREIITDREQKRLDEIEKIIIS